MMLFHIVLTKNIVLNCYLESSLDDLANGEFIARNIGYVAPASECGHDHSGHPYPLHFNFQGRMYPLIAPPLLHCMAPAPAFNRIGSRPLWLPKPWNFSDFQVC